MSLNKSSSSSIGIRSGSSLASQMWDDIQTADFERLANKWFSELGSAPLSKVLLQNTESLESLKIIRHWLKDFFEPVEQELVSGFSTNPDLFGRAVNMEKSELGKALIQTLESEGYKWSWATKYAKYLEFNKKEDLAADQRDSIRLSLSTDDGNKSTSDGNLKLYLEVRKLKTGVESLIVWAPVLVSSRPINSVSKWYVDNRESGVLEFDEVPFKDLRKALQIGDWPQNIVQPILIKKLFVLAESGTSNPLSGDEVANTRNSEVLPPPIMFSSQNMHVERGFVGQDGFDYVSAITYPSITNMGWVIPSSESSNLSSHLKMMSDGLRTVDQVLLHASRGNSNSKIYASVWAKATLPSTMMLGSSQCKHVNGAARWYSAGAGLEQLFRTDDVASQIIEGNLDETGIRKKLEELVEFGVGSSYASWVNTYVFSHLLDEREFELASRLLGYAIQMKVPRESLNAKSNLGIVYYIQGRFDEAESEFLGAIEQFQVAQLAPYSPDEPYRYLAEIAKIRGDKELEESYLEKCNEFGGYDNELFDVIDYPQNQDDDALENTQTFLDSQLPKTSEGLGQQVETLGNFCISCGTKFAETSDRFCGQCGESRK